MTYIINISAKTPDYRYAQSELVGPLQSIFESGSAARRKLPVLCGKSDIAFRHSVLSDFNGHPGEDKLYDFKTDKKEMPHVGKRMQAFRALSLPLAETTVLDLMERTPACSLDEITHVIAVSCTGLSAPGMEILIPERLQMKKQVQRFGVNFMGCYGALHGMKIADMICKTQPDSVVLMVCVELCTLHLRNDMTDDNLLSSSLFGDGAAAVLFTNRPGKGDRALEMLDFNNTVIEKGRCDMEWQIGIDGFQMKLSAGIPKHVEQNLKTFFLESLKKSGLRAEAIRHYAIHPGGKRILEAFAKSLGLDSVDLWASFTILRNFGNMSSPSVLFVLKELWDNKVDTTSEEHIFTAAFGPGLTIEAAFLKTAPQYA